MKISEEEVRYVAKLANLELSLDEIKQFASQLSDILEHMESLNEVSAENVESMAQVIAPGLWTRSSTPEREDAPQPSLGAPAALSNSPEPDGKYFKVPKVIAER